MRSLTILGATGSIGRQALAVAGACPDRFQVRALVAHSNAAALFEAVRVFRPRIAGLVVRPAEIPDDLKDCQWVFGEDCAERVVEMSEADDVLAAMVGIAGLSATLKALKHSKRLLLANKEALVTGGALVMERARSLGRELLPVDSEHSAIFQCLQGAHGNAPRRILLTASGGPFRTWNKSDIESAQIADALGHPTWKMGRKITVDCATMMNKGLEVIEAHHLFSMPLERIQVVVHPQSVVHSMVEFEDGAVMMQAAVADMRGPIAYAMGYPRRLDFGGARLAFEAGQSLTFEAPDFEKFPCLKLAYEAQAAGGVMPVVLNGANEAAVKAFLDGEIPFGGIARIVAETLEKVENGPLADVDYVFEADRVSREAAGREIAKICARP